MHLGLYEYKIKTSLGTIGDFATEWVTPKDWADHAKYVKQLKLEGRYLEEVEQTVSAENCPILDNIDVTPLVSHRMIILDNERS